MRYFFIILFAAVHGAGISQQVEPDMAAISIVKRALDSVKLNDPSQAINDYSYTSYRNLKITGNPKAIVGPGKRKSTLRETLKKSHVFISERISIYNQNRKEGEKEVVIASNMSGFDDPVNQIFTITFQTENLYSDIYTLFDTDYAGPMSEKGFKNYHYQLGTDTLINNRASIRILITPKRPQKIPGVHGTLFLDKETLGISHAGFHLSGETRLRAIHNYNFNPELQLWIPESRDLYMILGQSEKEIALFGGRISVGRLQDVSEDNIPDDQQRIPKEIAENLYLILKVRNSEFQYNHNQAYGLKGVNIVVNEDAGNDNDSLWEKHRNEKITTNDLATFMELDSIVIADQITRKLQIMEKFNIGYFPIGFFDIDLKYLVKYNDYESFRFGLGGVTNRKFSEKFRINGYIAYGFKDDAWKYGIGAGVRLSEEKNTWLNINRSDDITEFAAAEFRTDARVYSLFEPRLLNIPTFYKYKDYSISLQQRLDARLISEIALSRKRISQTTSYQYQPDNINYQEYVLTEATLGANWNPYSEYMRTPVGYSQTISGYPVISAQVTQGIGGLFKSDFTYTKLSGRISYVIDRLNQTSTSFLTEGHIAFGEVPLTHLFHAYPNAPNKDEVLQRFSVAGRRSFETMYFNEFFSDRIMTAQVKHSLAPFNIASWLKPELVLITRFAIGDLNDKEDHVNIAFDTLEKGYLESGFELNQLLFGFGVSTAYRYGAYHLPKFADNLSLKFTFYLEL